MKGGAQIRHLDDVPFIEVAKFRLAGGRIAVIREKWLELTPRYVAFYSEWDPGALSPCHGHNGDHSVVILAGSIVGADVTCGPGTHLMLEWGDTFGPWEAGPDGCTMYGFIAGDGKPFLRADLWQEFLAEKGAVEISVAIPDIPVWHAGGPLLVNPTQGEPTR